LSKFEQINSQQNLAIQQHSAVSPQRKPATCPRAMKKRMCTRVHRPDYRTFQESISHVRRRSTGSIVVSRHTCSITPSQSLLVIHLKSSSPVLTPLSSIAIKMEVEPRTMSHKRGNSLIDDMECKESHDPSDETSYSKKKKSDGESTLKETTKK
jgi:hypothetical protein